MFVDALAAVGVDRPDRLYWAGRATLTRSPEDAPRYDRAFATFWLGRPSPAVDAVAALELRVQVTDDASGIRYSATEVLRHKDFALYSREEFDEARRLMADIRLAGALQRTRRRRRSNQSGGHPDLRRTVRRALRTGGEPLRRAFLDSSLRPRRVVLLCDVSGSMDPYARALLRLLHAAVAGPTRVEAFALGTRLTRLSRELSSRDPDAALAAAARSVADWSGGTRLGAGLRAFNDGWGIRGMARGAVVVIMSDGWDRGDPAELADELARLRRVAYRIVWVNPLKGSPGYAPLAQGMATALPFVDAFVDGHSLAALEELAKVVRASK